MVVCQIHVAGVPVLETEDHAPVGADCYAPETPPVALERVQPEPRQVHVLRRAGPVQNGKNVPHLLHLIGADSLVLIALEQPLKPLVPEALDHGEMVAWKLTIVNCLPPARNLANLVAPIGSPPIRPCTFASANSCRWRIRLRPQARNPSRARELTGLWLRERKDCRHLHPETGKDLSAVEFFLGGKDFDVLEGTINGNLPDAWVHDPYQGDPGGQIFIHFAPALIFRGGVGARACDA